MPSLHAALTRRHIIGAGATLAGSAMLRGWERSAKAQEATPVPIQGQIAFGQPDRTADVYKPLIAGAKLEGQAARLRGAGKLRRRPGRQADCRDQHLDRLRCQSHDHPAPRREGDAAGDREGARGRASSSSATPTSSPMPTATPSLTACKAARWSASGSATGSTRTWAAKRRSPASPLISTRPAASASAARKRRSSSSRRTRRSSTAPRRCSPRRRSTATQSILQANPNVNVILCIADDGCLGAAQAVRGHRPRSEYRLHRRLGRLARGDEAHHGRGTRFVPPAPSTSSRLAAPRSGCRPTSSRTKSRRTTPATTSW